MPFKQSDLWQSGGHCLQWIFSMHLLPPETKVSLALEFARDGALIMQLTEAFGGIYYLSGSAREFIENWEVESYRSEQL